MRHTRTTAIAVLTCFVVGWLASGFAQPSPRGLVEMAYDSESELFVLYGGLTGPFDRAGSVVGGTWVFDPATGTWAERTPDPSPPALLAANLVYDAESDLFVLWGGADPSFTANTDVWTYDVDADVWTKLALDPAAGPEHRAGSRMAYDESADVVVMFGGQDTTNGSYPTTTWLLDIDTPEWRQVETDESPRGRFYYGLAYEATSELVYLWGGGFPVLGSLWAFDASEGSWTEIATESPAPFPQGYLGMVAEPALGGLLTLGGEMQGNEAMWRFDVEAQTWSEIGRLPFDVRNRFAIAHAPGYGTLVFGGQVGNASFSFSSETWRFDPTEGAWRQQ